MNSELRHYDDSKLEKNELADDDQPYEIRRSCQTTHTTKACKGAILDAVFVRANFLLC